MSIAIYPSLIAADLLDLRAAIQKLNKTCEGFHIDIMDGHFVHNITWGPNFVQAIAKESYKPVWIHLMVEKPEEIISMLEMPGGSMVTFHIENSAEKSHLIKFVKEKNWKVGLAINPKTSIEQIFPYAHLVDQVLVMTVQPGFYGQIFDESALNKIEPLLGFRATSKLPFSVACDGGINKNNIKMLVQKYQIDTVAVASGIFSQPNPVVALQELRNAALAK